MSGPELAPFYLTFGSQYGVEDHPILPGLAHPDGWIRLDAPDEGFARQFLAVWLQGTYSMIYAGTDPHSPLATTRYYPRGELAHFELRRNPDGHSADLRVISSTGGSDTPG